ncbi:hypothetical protein [Spiroplasma litorale]|nr:hypothetical protein [Spiroplasma litorale]
MIKKIIKKQLRSSWIVFPNSFGKIATVESYKNLEWAKELLDYLKENYIF